VVRSNKNALRLWGIRSPVFCRVFGRGTSRENSLWVFRHVAGTFAVAERDLSSIGSINQRRRLLAAIAEFR
jgi:hypothetical protein